MHYVKQWDLKTIPDDPLYSEVGRRRRAKNPGATTPAKLAPCLECRTVLNATQRRKPCPKCGLRQDDRMTARERTTV